MTSPRAVLSLSGLMALAASLAVLERPAASAAAPAPAKATSEQIWSCDKGFECMEYWQEGQARESAKATCAPHGVWAKKRCPQKGALATCEMKESRSTYYGPRDSPAGHKTMPGITIEQYEEGCRMLGGKSARPKK